MDFSPKRRIERTLTTILILIAVIIIWTLSGYGLLSLLEDIQVLESCGDSDTNIPCW